MNFDPDFWRNKRVIVTGYSGFKGSWLTLWLKHLGAIVKGISLLPETMPNIFELAQVSNEIENDFCDIRDLPKLKKSIQEFNPEIVFHLAAQALVLTSYKQPVLTYMTNIMGTVHMLESLRNLPSVKVAVMITTDKVYRNNEWIFPYREVDSLGGLDPYSSSKAAAEIIIASYRDSFLSAQGVAVASARAGNVIGGGDWSENRLIPDAVVAWQNQKTLMVRHPNAVRPWQHVLEPLAGYIVLARKLWEDRKFSEAWNFGPDPAQNASVQDVVELARQAFGSGKVVYCPCDDDPYEAGQLKLETTKSRCQLKFDPQWDLAKTVEQTITWYKLVAKGYNARKLCLEQIEQYQSEL